MDNYNLLTYLSELVAISVTHSVYHVPGSYRQPLSLERSGYEINLRYQQVSMYISTLQTSVKIS